MKKLKALASIALVLFVLQPFSVGRTEANPSSYSLNKVVLVYDASNADSASFMSVDVQKRFDAWLKGTGWDKDIIDVNATALSKDLFIDGTDNPKYIAVIMCRGDGKQGNSTNRPIIKEITYNYGCGLVILNYLGNYEDDFFGQLTLHGTHPDDANLTVTTEHYITHEFYTWMNGETLKHFSSLPVFKGGWNYSGIWNEQTTLLVKQNLAYECPYVVASSYGKGKVVWLNDDAYHLFCWDFTTSFSFTVKAIEWVCPTTPIRFSSNYNCMRFDDWGNSHLESEKHKVPSKQDMINFLDLFKKYGAKGTTALICNNSVNEPPLLTEQTDLLEVLKMFEGIVVEEGVHGDNHDDFIGQPLDTQRARLQNCLDIIAEAGLQKPIVHIFPDNVFDSNTIQADFEKGLLYVSGGGELGWYTGSLGGKVYNNPTRGVGLPIYSNTALDEENFNEYKQMLLTNSIQGRSLVILSHWWGVSSNTSFEYGSPAYKFCQETFAFAYDQPAGRFDLGWQFLSDLSKIMATVDSSTLSFSADDSGTITTSITTTDNRGFLTLRFSLLNRHIKKVTISQYGVTKDWYDLREQDLYGYVFLPRQQGTFTVKVYFDNYAEFPQQVYIDPVIITASVLIGVSGTVLAWYYRRKKKTKTVSVP